MEKDLDGCVRKSTALQDDLKTMTGDRDQWRDKLTKLQHEYEVAVTELGKCNKVLPECQASLASVTNDLAAARQERVKAEQDWTGKLEAAQKSLDEKQGQLDALNQKQATKHQLPKSLKPVAVKAGQETLRPWDPVNPYLGSNERVVDMGTGGIWVVRSTPQ